MRGSDYREPLCDATGFSGVETVRVSSLKNMPRGYPVTHPLANGLRRTNFIWDRPVSHASILSAKLLPDVATAFRDVSPVVDYLCAALDLPY